MGFEKADKTNINVFMKPRPIYLNLFTFDFPITAIISILHRISGVILIFAIPLLIWDLKQSLLSEAAFEHLKLDFKEWPSQILLWGIWSALIFHLIAGIRHLLMDCHIGESKKGGRLSSFLTLIFFVIGSFLGGYWLWMPS